MAVGDMSQRVPHHHVSKHPAERDRSNVVRCDVRDLVRQDGFELCLVKVLEQVLRQDDRGPASTRGESPEAGGTADEQVRGPFGAGGRGQAGDDRSKGSIRIDASRVAHQPAHPQVTVETAHEHEGAKGSSDEYQPGSSGSREGVGDDDAAPVQQHQLIDVAGRLEQGGCGRLQHRDLGQHPVLEEGGCDERKHQRDQQKSTGGGSARGADGSSDQHDERENR
jgi:hypothetical protein